MKKFPFLAAMCVIALTNACTSVLPQGSPVSVADLKTAIDTQSAPPENVLLTVTIVDTHKKPSRAPLASASIVVRRGQKGKIEQIREYISPIDYALPSLTNSAIAPASPTKFQTTNAGWTIDLLPEHKGSLAVLTGRITFIELDRFIALPGEAFRPIASEDGTIFADNRATIPIFEEYVTPLVLMGSYGTTHRMEVGHPRRGICADIRIDPVSRN